MGRHEQYDDLRGQNTARTREATYYTSKTSVAGDTAFFSLFDEEDAVWGTRPTSLVEPRGPEERIQRHTAEQMIESFVPVPVLDLDAPVPQIVDQLVDVLKLFDTAIPEQVIAVPKIPLDSIPHRAVFEPQLAEQLVEVPTPVTHVGRSLFTDRHGHEWCRVMGPTRAYWWRVGTPHTQWAPPPEGLAIQVLFVMLGGCLIGHPCEHARQVPAVLADCQWIVLQVQFIGRLWNSSFATETGTNSVNSAEYRRSHSAILGWLLTRPLLCDDRCRRWSRQYRKQFGGGGRS